MLQYDVIYPEQIRLGDLAYFEGDIPSAIGDFKQVTRIDRDGSNGEYLFYVDDQHTDAPYSIDPTELVYRIPNPKLSDFQEAAQRKAARNSIAGLLANAPEVIEVYKNLLSALAGLDDPRRALDLLDMVVAVGLPGAERRISTITSVCQNGHQETADIPENAGPQDIIEALAELRSTCPECETAEALADYQEIMEGEAEMFKSWAAFNPSGLDPLPPENE